MGIGRIGKHLLANRSRVRMAFSKDALARIEQAIKARATKGPTKHPSLPPAVPIAMRKGITMARAFTDTFTGIRLVDVPGFVVGQTAGTAAAVLLLRWFNGVQDRRSAR